MRIYAIADLHLSLVSEKPMDVFGEAWRDHADKIDRNWREVVREDDLVLIPGDISWAMQLSAALPDLAFIGRLPGKKLLLKGNHDYWWSTASAAKKFFAENDISTIDILHNNFFEYGDAAICGTRGWFYEEEKGGEHDRKILARECLRLEASLKAAGDREKYVFLHYPPKYLGYECPEILKLLKDYDVKMCCFGHIHSKGCASAFCGELNGTAFKLVSADYLDFVPAKII